MADDTDSTSGPAENSDPSEQRYRETGFQDTADVPTTREELRTAKKYAEMIIGTVHEGLLVLDLDLRVKSANQSFCEMFEVRPEEIIGRPLFDLQVLQWDTPKLTALLEETLPERKDFDGFEIELSFKERGPRTLLLNARQIDNQQLVLLSIKDLTEHKRTEQALRERESQLATAVQIAQLGIWEYDPEARVTYWDARCREVFGVSEDRPYQDEEVLELIHPEDRARLREAVRTALDPEEGRGHYEADYRIVRPDGTQRWVAARGRAVEAGAGASAPDAPVPFVGTLMDITDRKETEETLESAVAQFGAIFRQMTEGLLIFDAAGNLLNMNPAALAIHGLDSMEHVEGAMENLTEIFEAFDLQGRPLPLEEWPVSRAIRGETFERCEVRVHRRDTGKTWIGSYGGAPVYGPDGELLRAVLTLRDVTEKREAEEALRESEEAMRALNDELEERVEERTRQVQEQKKRFQKLVDASAQILWSTDAEGRLQKESASWAAFTGQPFEEHRGHGYLNALHPDDRLAVKEVMRQARERLAPFDTELRLYHAESDSFRWMQLRGVPLFDDEEALEGWIGMYIDVDERKRAEQQVHQLVHALTEAEEEERRRIGSILHDDVQQEIYAAQLTAGWVQEELEALRDEETAASVARQLEKMKALLEEAARSTRTLSHELSPSVLEDPNFSYSLRWLAVHVEERHGLTVEIDLQDDIYLENRDLRALLLRLVRELMFNVVKHARASRTHLSAYVEEGWLIVQVRDEGRGFDPEEIETGGGGYGLASVRERLRLLDGQMQVESTRGEGTRVTLQIPKPSPKT